jgi:hypothetical protein
MASFFPGMDPYLEDPTIWPDFHTTLIVAIKADLNSRLPPGYIAATDRHVWIERPRTQRRRLREPDVFVSRTKTKAAAAPALMTRAPRNITLPLPERKGRPYLKIMDARDRRVVTVLELLSPINKAPGKHYEEYLAKRDEYFSCGVNFIEVNLLRAGKHPPLGELETADLQYYVLVCRARELPSAAIWTFTVRDPFPKFPIPLRTKEYLEMNLRQCMDRTYQDGHYDVEVDYRQPPVPPFIGEDARWVREFARKCVH